MNQGIQPSFSNVTQNLNMSHGMPSLDMQEDNFTIMIPGQNLGYQQFLQSQQPNQQQSLRPYNFPHNQNLYQHGSPSQNTTDVSIIEMERSLLQGTMNGAVVTERLLLLVSNLLQYGTSTTTLSTSTSTSSTNSIMVATLQQDKLCHLLGWLGCNNAQTAWSFNNSA